MNNFKENEKIVVYGLDDEYNPFRECGVVDEDTEDYDEMVWVKLNNLSDVRGFHKKQCRKLIYKPKLFSNYEIGQEVNVFTLGGKFNYTGIVVDTELDNSSFLVEPNNGGPPQWERPALMRKANIKN
jgi:hypothetical protein